MDEVVTRKSVKKLSVRFEQQYYQQSSSTTDRSSRQYTPQSESKRKSAPASMSIERGATNNKNRIDRKDEDWGQFFSSSLRKRFENTQILSQQSIVFYIFQVLDANHLHEFGSSSVKMVPFDTFYHFNQQILFHQA